jgi:hypothetical protein
MNVIPLHLNGYCAHCAKPILAGQLVCDVRTPDGTERLHAKCVGPSIDPPPTRGGSPAALKAA